MENVEWVNVHEPLAFLARIEMRGWRNRYLTNVFFACCFFPFHACTVHTCNTCTRTGTSAGTYCLRYELFLVMCVLQLSGSRLLYNMQTIFLAHLLQTIVKFMPI